MASIRRPIDIAVQTAGELAQQKLTDFTRENLYIGIPAIVVNTDDYETEQCIDVKPVINDVYDRESGTVVEARTLKKIFVRLYEGGGFKIKLPVAVDDKCVLHYAHRDLSDFLDGDGGSVDNDITLVADRRDCWAEIGFGTRSNNQSPSKTDFIIEGDNTNITITPAGKITGTTADNIEITTQKDAKLNCVNAEVTCTTKATVTSPESEFNGNVTINGNLTVTQTTTSDTISATSSLQAAGAEVVGHDHSGNVPPLA